jgi:FKBP-type peptidyl-prolyl cis-trans isomerase
MRALLVALPLVAALAGCGSDGGKEAASTPTPGASVTPLASGTPACAPTGRGTTNLAVKPTVERGSVPAPTETTTYDIVCGAGQVARKGDNVQVKYVGVLYTDGREFDSSWKVAPDYTLSFQVGGGNIIPGFSKGVEGMRVGGRREVVIPAKDAYGDQGIGDIPPGATLIFVLDLVKAG